MTWRRLYLVRHGEAEEQTQRLNGRAPGVRLTRRGRLQAEAVGLALKNRGVGVIYTSPAARAAETAGIIADITGAPIETQESLAEVDFGDWSGRPFASLEGDAAWRSWNADRGRAHTPGGEGMIEVQARAQRWLASTLAREEQNIVAVSHGDVIKALVAAVIGLPLHFYDRFDIATGSLTTLRQARGDLTLERLNEEIHAAPH